MSRLYLDKNQVSKVDLQITTNSLFTECGKCKNSFAVGNFEDFLKNVRTVLENKLIYEGVAECGVVELNYCFECPVCLQRKKIPLELKLESEKTLLLFSTKISKEKELLSQSVQIFKKHLRKGKKNDKK